MEPAAKVTLNNGVLMDQAGYGTYKVPPADTASLVSAALSLGYRHIDTAALYGNEEGVGAAVRNFTDAGHVVREDLFVTSKLWNTDQGYDAAFRAFDTSMEKLGFDYLDLYLIHWPCPARGLFTETYRALEELYAQGRIRAIGVSNFHREHLEELMDATSVVPAVNQVEAHPWLNQSDLLKFHDAHGIRTVAWSPLGRGAVLEDPVVKDIAVDTGRSAAQVVLRWHLQNGNTVIPKASSEDRMAANLDIFSFELSAEQMSALNELDCGRRTGSDPSEVN
ncbi:aldo/keto reductase [Arthrobacter sp. zg-Y916]|uniref:Aldo/keto reductase n=1 Tax=Arthrobacter caoxuetaonis TaxID=2886935 RepID=A0A9X1MFA6_9MICC|nr:MULTISPECIES: aldo/keto reductase [Arthrobacter]MCC3297877.1 aldo/keto reductase [Arthrobacter caoxuetaonis]MCC9193581.1 aldo/keto reductase [Arthrobacter sp. zg-Y916]USQ55937.1 aldo/keto reductase [Arthrobacter caoxuetaonis]